MKTLPFKVLVTFWVILSTSAGVSPLSGWAQLDDNPFLPDSLRGKGSRGERLALTAELAPLKLPPGGITLFTLNLEPKAGFHTYPAIQKDPNADSFVTFITIEGPVQIVGTPEQTEPEYKQEEGIGLVGVYSKPAKIVWQLQVKRDAKTGPALVKIKVKTQVCDQSCVPVDKEFSFTLTVNGTSGTSSPTPTDVSSGVVSPPAAGTPANTQAPSTPQTGTGPLSASAPATPTTGVAEASVDAGQLKAAYEALIRRLVRADGGSIASKAEDLWGFLAAGAIIGLLSVFTPCVFPMIPITVSIFLKKSEEEHHQPLVTALVYCGTIVVVLTLSAVFLLSVMQTLSQNPVMNFVIGGLFIYFALSLFGLYEIELPSFISRFTSAREKAGGQAGTIFSALTFTIISFSCVAPFLGGFAGAATQARPWHHVILGGLAFAAAFASPFFLLAFFPSLLRRLKSGSWLNNVKVVMGFLELAAAFKFLRAAELGLRHGAPAEFFTYDLVLALWIGICLACGLYLLNHFRLAYDSNVDHIGVGRLLFALAFLGLGLHLLPALWPTTDGRVRPAGSVFAWIDSFLLDEPSPAERGWSTNLEAAVRRAMDHRKRTQQPRLIFIDFTGIQCVNCRINEKAVFPRPEIKTLLDRFELVKLYTDTREPIGDTNKWFQETGFGTLELPLYVILEPRDDGTILVHGSMGGKIQNTDSFAAFLRRPLETASSSR